MNESQIQGELLKQKTTSDVPMTNGCHFKIRVHPLWWHF